MWAILVGCGKEGIPEELMLSFPAAVREGEYGLKAWQNLFQRALLVSDQSIGALQGCFDSPKVVKRPGLLLGALNDWKNIVVNGAVICGMIPLKDAVFGAIQKGLRA